MAKNKEQKSTLSCGAAIRVAREKYGYSRETLAFRASISPRYLAMIELGQRNPSLECLIAIANALACTTDELLRLEAGISISNSEHILRLFGQCNERDRRILILLLEQMVPNQ